jgi:A/G-specific adenine glycosylase
MELPNHLKESRNDLQTSLLEWFEHNRREFPWRKTKNIFEILLAEKLLQQTKARASVITAYKLILKQYPTVELLAKGNLAEIREIVRPLGLIYRAQEIKAMAGDIVSIHSGSVPSDLKSLMSISGIGEYCARAVLSFGYMQKVAIVDTNVARWLHRLCGIELPLPSNPARKKYLYDLADALLPETNSRDFNLAILDLCALICKPKNPKCYHCPVQQYCVYGQKSGLV